jgi:hypothetical protein
LKGGGVIKGEGIECFLAAVMVHEPVKRIVFLRIKQRRRNHDLIGKL